MSKKIKETIYSTIESRFIDVMDVAKIIVEDDESSDLGYFKVIALLHDHGKGAKRFTGKIDNEGWTKEGLLNFAKTGNDTFELRNSPERFSVVEIGSLYVKPDTKKNEADMWRDMWKNIQNRANKFAKEIKDNQILLEEKHLFDSIVLRNY